MKKQDYKNHARYYYPHHFIFYPVAITLAIISICQLVKHNTVERMLITALFVLVIWVSFMLRQHYALNNQNRIVRLEFRLRYYVLTQQPFDAIERQLSFGQIAALRFASNEELLSLIDRTLKEHLNPGEIKRSIKNWVPDHMRV